MPIPVPLSRILTVFTAALGMKLHRVPENSSFTAVSHGKVSVMIINGPCSDGSSNEALWSNCLPL